MTDKFYPVKGCRVKNNSANCPNSNCFENSLSLEWAINFNSNPEGEVRCFQCNTIIGKVVDE
jgi:hypothetical protein